MKTWLHTLERALITVIINSYLQGPVQAICGNESHGDGKWTLHAQYTLRTVHSSYSSFFAPTAVSDYTSISPPVISHVGARCADVIQSDHPVK